MGKRRTPKTPSGDLALARNPPLTPSERAAVREKARRFAECMRNASVKASTESTDIRERRLSLAQASLIRLDFDRGGADVAVQGSTASAKRTKRSLQNGNVTVTRRVVVKYDSRPSSRQRRTVDRCVERATAT